jgi:hypothetical protein
MPDLTLADQKRKQLRIDFAETFSTPHGKRVLCDLMDQCHILKISFVPGKTDVVSFSEGERNVGNYILQMLLIETFEDYQKIAEGVNGT